MTNKEAREKLNTICLLKEGKGWKNNQFHQRTRPYGDYLFAQDRVMFDEVKRRMEQGEDIK